MAQTSITIHVEPGSDLERALNEAGDAPIELENRGTRYRVTRVPNVVSSDDIWAGYEPARALEDLRSAVGGWSGLVDAETS